MYTKLECAPVFSNDGLGVLFSAEDHLEDVGVAVTRVLGQQDVERVIGSGGEFEP